MQPLPRRAFAFALTALAAGGLAACSNNSSGPAVAPSALAAATDGPSATTGVTKPVVKSASNSSIPVLVNDSPITAYDINQRLRLMRLGGGKATEKDAINELIDETLEVLEASRRGVIVSEAQVEGAYAQIGERLKMSPDAFTKALASQGIQAASLKKRLQAQISWQQLVQRRVATKGAVKGEEVNAALAAKGDPKALTMREFTLQQIVFVVPAGSSAATFAQRRNEANSFRQRFPGCDQSLAKAKLLRGVVVKDIGRRDSSQLTGPDGEAIQNTPVGKTAAPVQTDQGIELIAVCSSRAIQSTSAARDEVENNLYMLQAEGLGKDYLKELRDRAIIEYR